MKLNDFYKNMKHTGGTCPSCKNSELFSMIHFMVKHFVQNAVWYCTIRLGTQLLNMKKGS